MKDEALNPNAAFELPSFTLPFEFMVILISIELNRTETSSTIEMNEINTGMVLVEIQCKSNYIVFIIMSSIYKIQHHLKLFVVFPISLNLNITIQNGFIKCIFLMILL